MSREKRLARLVAFAVVPLALVVLCSPFAVAVLFLGAPVPGWVRVGTAATWLCGLVCLPGYLFAAWQKPSLRSLPTRRRWWIRLSLAGAIPLGVAVAVFGALLLVPIVLGPACSFLAATLWSQCERAPAVIKRDALPAA